MSSSLNKDFIIIIINNFFDIDIKEYFPLIQYEYREKVPSKIAALFWHQEEGRVVKRKTTNRRW